MILPITFVTIEIKEMSRKLRLHKKKQKKEKKNTKFEETFHGHDNLLYSKYVQTMKEKEKEKVSREIERPLMLFIT
jgi:hypothetical protein